MDCRSNDTSRIEHVTDVESELSQVLEAHTTYTNGESEDKTITNVYGNGLIYEYEEEDADSQGSPEEESQEKES